MKSSKWPAKVTRGTNKLALHQDWTKRESKKLPNPFCFPQWCDLRRHSSVSSADILLNCQVLTNSTRVPTHTAKCVNRVRNQKKVNNYTTTFHQPHKMWAHLPNFSVFDASSHLKKTQKGSKLDLAQYFQVSITKCYTLACEIAFNSCVATKVAV